MTAERMDGDAIDPTVAKVLLFYREAVAQATALALRDLRALGVPDGVSLLTKRMGTVPIPRVEERLRRSVRLSIQEWLPPPFD